MPLSPGAAQPNEVRYALEDALPGLTFDRPVYVASAPGENNRLFVIERAGRIIVIPDLSNPARTVFLDISDRIKSDYEKSGSEGLSSIAFHPNYSQNRYFYVTTTISTRSAMGVGDHNRLSRFQTSGDNPNFSPPSSELALINQYDQGYGHNWNDLTFGPDGYLYVACGDEGDPNDMYQNSQRLDKDFFSGILRIDVDKRPGSLPPNYHPGSTGNYAIPSDNPYLGVTAFMGSPLDVSRVRTEFYAVGLRNPWRIWMDPVTGFLYCGDVGQHTSEEIDAITKGGNYGWAYLEGTHAGFRGDPPPGSSFIPPIVEYGHGYSQDLGDCVIGGVVYRGSQLGSLDGAYIFADYTSGNIWATHYDGATASPKQWLASETGIAGLGLDPRNGDVLLVNHDQGKVKRLVLDVANGGAPLPNTLSETGAFQDTAHLVPAPGVVPYDVNVSFWSDGSDKQRWFFVPAGQTIGFSPDSNWSFPAGTVWVKHFELEMRKGDPTSRRRIETRLLIKNQTGVYGVTYRWDDSQQNATLVPSAGLEETFQINDNGQTRSQTWHYPSRSECLVCHTPAAGYALGFNTAQLNRSFNYPSGAGNQIAAMNGGGFFDRPAANLHTLRSLAPADRNDASLEFRARSYLAANCAQCHQPGGSAQGVWDARFSTPLSASGIINGPLLNNGGDSANRVVKPGDPDHSMLLARIRDLGVGHMPPLATHELNSEGINLLHDWIQNELPAYEAFSDWQIRYFGDVNASAASPMADPDRDGSPNYLEYLTRGNPVSGSDPWKIQARSLGDRIVVSFPQLARRGFELQSTSTPNDRNSWMAVDAIGNEPFFSNQDRPATIEDRINSGAKFYRVRVFEP